MRDNGKTILIFAAIGAAYAVFFLTRDPSRVPEPTKPADQTVQRVEPPGISEATPNGASASATAVPLIGYEDGATGSTGYAPSGGYYIAPQPGAPVDPTPAHASTAGTDVQVRGYVKKDGTIVAPHTRSAPHRH